MGRKNLLRSLSVAAAIAALALATTGATASAHASKVRDGRTIVSVGANRSNNWSGYDQGYLEQGGKLFNSISGSWIVPTATPHKAGEAEYSASWIGIGGGCVDAGCTVTDTTLIQDGTEQDVDASGHATYSAWWELIPAPSVTLGGCNPDPNCTVNAADKMSSTIASTTSGVWTMSMTNATRGWSWGMTAAYSSTEATAEWIEETPVVIDNSGNVSVGPMPKLSTVHFDLATTDGASAGLKSSEEIQLIDFNGHVLATPSAPDPDTDGFNDCTYKTRCSSPTTS